MSISRKALFTLAALSLAAFAAHPAAAQSTLTGTFYHAGPATIGSVAQAQQFIASNSATGTFTSTASLLQSGYGTDTGGEDLEPVMNFLKTDGASYVGPNLDLSDGIFDIKGFLNVTTPNTYNFILNADDGAALFVDGTQVVNDDGQHAAQIASGTDTLTAGQHSVEVVYFNHNYNNSQGGAFLSADFNGLGTTPASAAPEPSQIGVLALVVLGLGAFAVKARKRATAAQTA